MAEFPPNLDDGELWLPSDIFHSEVPSSKCNDSQCRLSCMDDIAHQLAALSLLQNRLPKPAPNLQRVKPAVRGVSVSRLPGGGYFGFNNSGAELGQRLLHGHGTRTAPFLSRSDPFFEIQVSPTPQQVDSCLEIRRTRRALQQTAARIQNRVYPFQRSGFGSGGGGGGFVRESGGTGVFHPRPATNTAAATVTATATATEVKEKQGWRNRQEIQITQQRDSMKRVGVSKQEDCYCHLPPEMGLPRDWTY